MPTIMAGFYGFTDSQLSRISPVLQNFGFDPNIRTRSVNTARFTNIGAKRKLSPQILAEQGALRKAIEYIDTESPESLIIGVMLIAELSDGSILSNEKAWNPPDMRDHSVSFWLGVCLSNNGKIYSDTAKIGPYDTISDQTRIRQMVWKKMSDQPAIRPVNPYTTHPECYIRDHESLNRSLGEALLRMINGLAVLMRTGKGNVIEKSMNIAMKHPVGTTVDHVKRKGADIPQKRALRYFAVEHVDPNAPSAWQAAWNAEHKVGVNA
ncbi:MAG: hypothetical protein WCL23_01715 [Candidatus Moraniibacteriota bacterium]